MGQQEKSIKSDNIKYLVQFPLIHYKVSSQNIRIC